MIHVTIQQLSSYLDDQLAEGSADLVRQHLTACPECEARLGAMGRMDAALARVLSHEPGEDLLRRLERQIEAALGPGTNAKAEAEAGTVGDTPAPAPARTTATASTPTSTSRGTRGTPRRSPAAARATHSRPAAESAPQPEPRPAPVREVPSTAWTPSAARASAIRPAKPPRQKGSSAAGWIAVFSLALIAGSAGVVVSHSGSMQGWLDGLVSSPKFPAGRLAAPSTEPTPEAVSPTAWDSTAAAAAAPDGAPGLDASVTTDPSATSPLPPATAPPPAPARRPANAQADEGWDMEPYDGEEISPETMSADEVMGSPGASAGSGRSRGGTPRDDPYANLRPEVQAEVREAERVHEQTLFHPTAEQFDIAALRWERTLESVTGPEQVIVRGRLADARFRAWEARPTPVRADAASAAIRSYLLFAPPGIAREEAKARLARISPR